MSHMMEPRCVLKNLTRTSPLACLFSLFLNGAGALAQASQVPLAWDPSSSTGFTGYRLYQGGVSGNYTNQISVGNVTTTVSNLTAGATYYFAVSALSSNGLESVRSGEI